MREKNCKFFIVLAKPITKINNLSDDVIVKNDVIPNFWMCQYFVICNIHTKFQSNLNTSRGALKPSLSRVINRVNNVKNSQRITDTHFSTGTAKQVNVLK